MRHAFLACLLVLIGPGGALADKSSYLNLARQGWNYELRDNWIGRDLSIPVHINGRDLSGASLCVVGERPHPASLEVIDSFRALAAVAFGKPVLMRYAGADARGCGTGRSVVLRLYSGHPPNRALSADLAWMSEVYGLGLPAGRHYVAASPAMAQTFFGRRGQGSHIMVMQPAFARLDAVEAAYFKSILIEELFQTFTFGMDILLFDPARRFQSKLQETPLRLGRLAWSSRPFMEALLRSNPSRLCEFDVFMLHAVALSPADQTTQPVFIDFIDSQFDQLLALASQTMADPRLEPIIDQTCKGS